MNPVYNLFMRQWLRGEKYCKTEDIDEAVTKGLITWDDGDTIKNTPR